MGQKYFNKTEAAAAGRERDTKPIYLGSFSSRLDPRRLAGVEHIGPGNVEHGVTVKSVLLDDGPFELDATDVQEIRAWLMANGSWALAQKSMEQFRAEQGRLRVEERAQMEAELRAELGAQLRTQLLAELTQEMEARRAPALVEAVRAVEAAGVAVREEAARLVSAGQRMTTRRGKGGEAVESPVLQLLDRTLALRIKLMAGRKASPTKRKVTKLR